MASPPPPTAVSLPTPAAFPFPYPSGPYPIQLDLMRHLYSTLERAQLGIVQSPTGTGKSLSLLTSSIQWLRDDQRRRSTAELDAYRSLLAAEADPSDPAWVTDQLVERKRAELARARQVADERLEKVRREEDERARRAEFGEPARGAGAGGGGRKKARIAVELEADDNADDRFLPSSTDGPGGASAGGSGGGEGREGLQEGEMYLSAEVRALMAQMNPSAPDPADARPAVPTKIFFASRTHSQLSQVFAELRKTTFAQAPSANDTGGGASAEPRQPAVRALALGSRRNLCVNPSVLAGGPTGLDERCLDLLSTSSGCSFLPSHAEGGMETSVRGRTFGDKVLSRVRDVEDLRRLGEDEGCCSYYGSRALIDQAEIIALPYNLVLHASARSALSINLANNVLIIDEAHNLIDTLLAIHSVSTTSAALRGARAQLETYVGRFKGRLKSENGVRLKQALGVLDGLLAVCETFASGATSSSSSSSSRLTDVAALLAEMGRAADQVNLLGLAGWLADARIAVKVSGYAEKVLDDEIRAHLSSDPSRAARLSALKHSSIAAFHSFTALLRALTSANADGRVLLSLADPPPPSSSAAAQAKARRPVVNVKYLLLNPGEVFKDVVADARSVVLAGGTMEPVSDFSLQLLPQLPPAALANFSCGHVIPPDNLLTLVVPRGPKGRELEFKFAGRDDEGLLDELGATLSNACNLVPDGVVVFFPSYAFLEKVKALWTKSGLLQKLDAKKTVFYEPQAGASVDSVLAEYTNAILSPVQPPPSSSAPGARATRRTGALLFAVVGAKLSEGINFSDRLARAVVMVGLPFPNVNSPELKERMRYVEDVARAQRRPDAKNAGRELYMNLCMKAVNQSIGRAIRHANDYAVLILVDKRYSQPAIRAKLPKWITGDVSGGGGGGGVQGKSQVVVCESFGDGVKGLAGFFRGKKDKAA